MAAVLGLRVEAHGRRLTGLLAGGAGLLLLLILVKALGLAGRLAGRARLLLLILVTALRSGVGLRLGHVPFLLGRASGREIVGSPARVAASAALLGGSSRGLGPALIAVVTTQANDGLGESLSLRRRMEGAAGAVASL